MVDFIEISEEALTREELLRLLKGLITLKELGVVAHSYDALNGTVVELPEAEKYWRIVANRKLRIREKVLSVNHGEITTAICLTPEESMVADAPIAVDAPR